MVQQTERVGLIFRETPDVIAGRSSALRAGYSLTREQRDAARGQIAQIRSRVAKERAGYVIHPTSDDELVARRARRQSNVVDEQARARNDAILAFGSFPAKLRVKAGRKLGLSA